jgi:hypothetical protein
VTEFWQGAVRAIITATPQVAAGKQINITLSILGRNGPVHDPSTLKTLQIAVTATGDGLPALVKVPVDQPRGDREAAPATSARRP